MIKTVIGIFDERDDAETAVADLRNSGFSPKDISILMKDENSRERIIRSGDTFGDSTLSGAAIGGVVGGLAGLLISIGAIAIPGIGAVLIGGPLAAALGLTGAAATTVSAAATGVLAGGLIGALRGIGLSAEDAQIYEERVRSGAILVAISTGEENAGDARSIFEDNNADQIRVLGTDIPADVEPYDESRYYAGMGAKGGRVSKSTRKRKIF